MLKLIAQQDDCAPDSLETFCKDMKIKTEYSFEEFKTKAEKVSVIDTTLQWKLKAYTLEISSDDPFYKLFINE
jgi:hypothetical protein